MRFIASISPPGTGESWTVQIPIKPAPPGGGIRQGAGGRGGRPTATRCTEKAPPKRGSSETGSDTCNDENWLASRAFFLLAESDEVSITVADLLNLVVA